MSWSDRRHLGAVAPALDSYDPAHPQHSNHLHQILALTPLLTLSLAV